MSHETYLRDVTLNDAVSRKLRAKVEAHPDYRFHSFTRYDGASAAYFVSGDGHWVHIKLKYLVYPVRLGSVVLTGPNRNEEDIMYDEIPVRHEVEYDPYVAQAAWDNTSRGKT